MSRMLSAIIYIPEEIFLHNDTSSHSCIVFTGSRIEWLIYFLITSKVAAIIILPMQRIFFHLFLIIITSLHYISHIMNVWQNRYLVSAATSYTQITLPLIIMYIKRKEVTEIFNFYKEGIESIIFIKSSLSIFPDI